jgi:hypothetical protein
LDRVTEALIAVEYPALLARAERAGWQCDIEGTTLKIRMMHAAGKYLYDLRGDLAGYNRIPPPWNFVDDTGAEGTYRAFPARASAIPGVASVFTEFQAPGRTAAPIICLPCNRLCFKEHVGIHIDWVLACWMAIDPKYTTLVEMVDRIHIDLQAGGGPWAPRT